MLIHRIATETPLNELVYELDRSTDNYIRLTVKTSNGNRYPILSITTRYSRNFVRMHRMNEAAQKELAKYFHFNSDGSITQQDTLAIFGNIPQPNNNSTQQLGKHHDYVLNPLDEA